MTDVLLSEKESREIIEGIKEKFPIAKCRDMLEKRKKTFKDEEILMIREFLITVSEITYQVFQNRVQLELSLEPEAKSKIIDLNYQNESDIEIKKAA